ncbi:hypothetical protein DFH09DRAFT_1502811 [Mycena vulgaris]|nr:hypothetical protein DFH09DRAFT_1502811 [Mycena vulgaris]
MSDRIRIDSSSDFPDCERRAYAGAGSNAQGILSQDVEGGTNITRYLSRTGRLRSDSALLGEANHPFCQFQRISNEEHHTPDGLTCPDSPLDFVGCGGVGDILALRGFTMLEVPHQRVVHAGVPFVVSPDSDAVIHPDVRALEFIHVVRIFHVLVVRVFLLVRHTRVERPRNESTRIIRTVPIVPIARCCCCSDASNAAIRVHIRIAREGTRAIRITDANPRVTRARAVIQPYCCCAVVIAIPRCEAIPTWACREYECGAHGDEGVRVVHEAVLMLIRGRGGAIRGVRVRADEGVRGLRETALALRIRGRGDGIRVVYVHSGEGEGLRGGGGGGGEGSAGGWKMRGQSMGTPSCAGAGADAGPHGVPRETEWARCGAARVKSAGKSAHTAGSALFPSGDLNPWSGDVPVAIEAGTGGKAAPMDSSGWVSRRLRPEGARWSGEGVSAAALRVGKIVSVHLGRGHGRGADWQTAGKNDGVSCEESKERERAYRGRFSTMEAVSSSAGLGPGRTKELRSDQRVGRSLIWKGKRGHVRRVSLSGIEPSYRVRLQTSVATLHGINRQRPIQSIFGERKWIPNGRSKSTAWGALNYVWSAPFDHNNASRWGSIRVRVRISARSMQMGSRSKQIWVWGRSLEITSGWGPTRAHTTGVGLRTMNPKIKGMELITTRSTDLFKVLLRAWSLGNKCSPDGTPGGFQGQAALVRGSVEVGGFFIASSDPECMTRDACHQTRLLFLRDGILNNVVNLKNDSPLDKYLTAIGSTEGAEENFPVRNVFRRIPQISKDVMEPESQIIKSMMPVIPSGQWAIHSDFEILKFFIRAFGTANGCNACWDILRSQMCTHCFAKGRDDHSASLRSFWGRLPTTSGLPPWPELHAMERDVIGEARSKPPAEDANVVIFALGLRNMRIKPELGLGSWYSGINMPAYEIEKPLTGFGFRGAALRVSGHQSGKICLRFHHMSVFISSSVSHPLNPLAPSAHQEYSVITAVHDVQIIEKHPSLPWTAYLGAAGMSVYDASRDVPHARVWTTAIEPKFVQVGKLWDEATMIRRETSLSGNRHSSTAVEIPSKTITPICPILCANPTPYTCIPIQAVGPICFSAQAKLMELGAEHSSSTKENPATADGTLAHGMPDNPSPLAPSSLPDQSEILRTHGTLR